jgi:hypothetical protein
MHSKSKKRPTAQITAAPATRRGRAAGRRPGKPATSSLSPQKPRALSRQCNGTDCARAGRRAARPTCKAQARARATESEEARADRAVQPCSVDVALHCMLSAAAHHARAPPKRRHSKSGAARWQPRPLARNNPAWSRSPPGTTHVLRLPTPPHSLAHQRPLQNIQVPVRSPPLSARARRGTSLRKHRTRARSPRPPRAAC